MTELLPYYSVVRILRTGRTAALGIDGREGVIVGVSQSGPRVEYGVMVGGEVCMAGGSDVAATGEVLSRDALYDGSSVEADPQSYPAAGNLTCRHG